jgi:hypothetical protein
MKKKFKELPPLTPREITRGLEDTDPEFKSLADFARRHGLHYWNLIAVIQRDERVVCQEIREFLASYLGVDVSRIGREPKRPVVAESASVAA